MSYYICLIIRNIIYINQMYINNSMILLIAYLYIFCSMNFQYAFKNIKRIKLL